MASRRLFGQMLNAHLRGQLRHAAPLSYTVSHSVDILRGGTAVLRIDADMGYARLEAALSQVRLFTDLGAPSCVSTMHLEHSRAALARVYNLRFSTTARIAEEITAYWNRGWPVAALDREPDALFEVKLDQVRTVAEHCRENSVVAILGDERRIRAAWARAAPTGAVAD